MKYYLRLVNSDYSSQSQELTKGILQVLGKKRRPLEYFDVPSELIEYGMDDLDTISTAQICILMLPIDKNELAMLKLKFSEIDRFVYNVHGKYKEGNEDIVSFVLYSRYYDPYSLNNIMILKIPQEGLPSHIEKDMCGDDGIYILGQKMVL